MERYRASKRRSPHRSDDFERLGTEVRNEMIRSWKQALTYWVRLLVGHFASCMLCKGGAVSSALKQNAKYLLQRYLGLARKEVEDSVRVSLKCNFKERPKDLKNFNRY